MAEETKEPEAPQAPDEAQTSEPPPSGTSEEAEQASSATGETQTATAEAPAAGESELSLEEVRGWAGYKLDDLTGHAVGKVEGVYVDDSSGRPEWLLARMGRFGHHCLLPARDAVAAAERVWVPYTRDQIRKAPRTEPNQPLERDREQALLEHYGIGSAEAGRGAALADAKPDAVTARPA